jgi:ABC-type sulfate transport system permease subunit
MSKIGGLSLPPDLHRVSPEEDSNEHNNILYKRALSILFNVLFYPLFPIAHQALDQGKSKNRVSYEHTAKEKAIQYHWMACKTMPTPI